MSKSSQRKDENLFLLALSPYFQIRVERLQVTMAIAF